MKKKPPAPKKSAASEKPPAKRKLVPFTPAAATEPPLASKPPQEAAPASEPVSEQTRALNALAERKGILPPSQADVPPPGIEGGFDPAAEAARINVWRLNQAGGCFFIPAEDGSWNAVNANELKRELKARGVSAVKPEDGSASNVERLLLHLQRHRNVESVEQALAGYKAGTHEIHGRRILVRKSFTLIEPKPGDFPTLRGLIEGILKPPGGKDLSLYFYGWLKMAYESLRTGSFRVGQIFYLIGPANCGKSRLQNQIITPLLGDRSADPLRYLTGRTDFNADLAGAEHLQVEDPDISPEFKERDIWGKRCKAIAANDSQRLHSKGKDATTFFPLWRISITQNDEQTSIDMLPPMEVFADKVLILHCRRPDPERFRLPETDEERIIFRNRCKEELPALAAWLLEWEIPEGYSSSRYGVASFIDPWVTREISAHSRETALLECIDLEVFKDAEPMLDANWQNADIWKGNATELSNLLTGDSSVCRSQARGLFKSAIPLGKLLKSLSELYPDRVKVAPADPRTRGYFLHRAKPLPA